MVREIGKKGVSVIQKITKPNGDLVGYQAGVPGDAGTMHRFPTLAEAKNFVGIKS